jgi:hypothetical protein
MNSRHRLATEKRTVRIMIELYCTAHHHPQTEICVNCEGLGVYALRKIDRCPFHEAKPVCADCKIHCYETGMRAQIREVMRYSGPKMILHHPWLAAMHVLNKMLKPGRKTESEPV